MLMITLQGIRELGLEEEIEHWLKAARYDAFLSLVRHCRGMEVSFGTVYVSFGVFKDIQSQVYASRGDGFFTAFSLPFRMLKCESSRRSNAAEERDCAASACLQLAQAA